MQSVPDSQNAGSISHAQCPSGLRRRLIAAAAAVTFLDWPFWDQPLQPPKRL